MIEYETFRSVLKITRYLFKVTRSGNIVAISLYVVQMSVHEDASLVYILDRSV